MNARIAVGCLLVWTFLMCPCQFAQQAQPQGKPASKPTPDSTGSSSEARQAVWDFWNQRFAKCGDIYYGIYNQFGRVQTARTKVKITVTPLPLKDEDRLKGISWEGSIEYRFETIDCFLDDTPPACIQKHQAGDIGIVTKRNGKWEIRNSDHARDALLHKWQSKPDCTKIMSVKR